jgi:hypothetical protein
MTRYSFRFALAACLTAFIAATAFSTGCRSAMSTAMYVIKGNDVEPEYAGLKGKKTAVVCRAAANSDAGRDLAREISRLLADRVPKIQVIDSQKTHKWCEENAWEDFTQVGKALNADVVVGVELEDITVNQTRGMLYQGKASASIHVYDCKDGGKVVFEKILPQIVYPPISFVQSSDVQEMEFRREFIGMLADQIARHFYKHDPYADMARDRVVRQ